MQELIKIAGDKVQTSLWLDRDVKRLIEDENLNLSKWVNENILISLSVEHEDQILEKIKGHEMSIKTLQSRLKTLQEREKDDGKIDSVKQQALRELREYYLPLAKGGATRERLLQWMMVPKKIARCKLLGKTVDQMLDELEVWYDGLQKDHDKEN